MPLISDLLGILFQTYKDLCANPSIISYAFTLIPVSQKSGSGLRYHVLKISSIPKEKEFLNLTVPIYFMFVTTELSTE